MNLNMKNVDFGVKVYKGTVSPINNSNNTEIEIYDENNFNIKIEGKNYNILSKQLIEKIKGFIGDNLNTLIEYSKLESNSFLDDYAYDGGVSRSIEVKWGQLLINIDGQVKGNIGSFAEKFIDYLKDLIIKEGSVATEEVITNTSSINSVETK